MSSAVTAQLTGRLAALAEEATATGRIGVDAVHIPTWARHLDIGGPALAERVYTPSEIAFCAGRTERLAARLAAKEAVLKVLGTGIRGIALRDVEIHSDPDGRPRVALHGRGAARARELGLDSVAVSLCHEDDFGLAVAAGTTGGRP
jgi:holo-[acyl-carrier protein] synthase